MQSRKLCGGWNEFSLEISGCAMHSVKRFLPAFAHPFPFELPVLPTFLSVDSSHCSEIQNCDRGLAELDWSKFCGRLPSSSMVDSSGNVHQINPVVSTEKIMVTFRIFSFENGKLYRPWAWSNDSHLTNARFSVRVWETLWKWRWSFLKTCLISFHRATSSVEVIWSHLTAERMGNASLPGRILTPSLSSLLSKAAIAAPWRHKGPRSRFFGAAFRGTMAEICGSFWPILACVGAANFVGKPQNFLEICDQFQEIQFEIGTFLSNLPWGELGRKILSTFRF